MDSGDDEVTTMIASAIAPTAGRTRISATSSPSWSRPAEHRLVEAVLAQAVQDLTRGPTKVRRDVRAWFANPAAEAWTFQWCCDIADLNADQVRRRIKLPLPVSVRRGKGSV